MSCQLPPQPRRGRCQRLCFLGLDCSACHPVFLTSLGTPSLSLGPWAGFPQIGRPSPSLGNHERDVTWLASVPSHPPRLTLGVPCRLVLLSQSSPGMSTQAAWGRGPGLVVQRGTLDDISPGWKPQRTFQVALPPFLCWELPWSQTQMPAEAGQSECSAHSYAMAAESASHCCLWRTHNVLPGLPIFHKTLKISIFT